MDRITRISASAAWLEHFKRSLRRADVVREEDTIVLTPAERDAIASSVQEFQLGESSEGRHLLTAAHRYADATGDFDYVAALRLFITEENRHARELGCVLDGAGIARISGAWSDSVFRWLRRRAGLELSIAVLITAEIIAKVYYAALRDATGCRPLRRLCEQILRDEHHHVIFQAQRLALLRHGRYRASILVRVALHRFLMAGTCLVVWRRHGRAMRAGGFGFGRFWRRTARAMNDALADMDPRNYPALSGGRAKPRSGGGGGGAALACVVIPPAAPRLSAPARDTLPARDALPAPNAPALDAPARDALQLTPEDVT